MTQNKTTRNQFNDRRGLPSWTYFNPELFDLEADFLFRKHWQLACHVSDVQKPGQYVTFDLVDERALIIKGQDGVIRAFHNLCRHRGSRVVAADQGICDKLIVCPFHGWSYTLDGNLRGVARPSTLPKLDPQEWGLKPIEMEIWQGFVFIRFMPSTQPSLSEIMKPYDDMVSAYQLADLEGLEGPEVSDPFEVNWKSMRDVDNEGYHVAMAHPGLNDLYGKDYRDYSYKSGGATHSIGTFNSTPPVHWSVRNYRKMVDALPEPWASLPKAWLYVAVFPNTVIGLYPDSVIFYQDIPVSPTCSRQRYAGYKRRDEDRVTRAARHLASRIDRITGEEDIQLMQWSFEAMKSSAFDDIILSDAESGVGEYHQLLKSMIPIMGLANEPGKGKVLDTNAKLTHTSDLTAE